MFKCTISRNETVAQFDKMRVFSHEIGRLYPISNKNIVKTSFIKFSML